jgi:hypothetical protein
MKLPKNYKIETNVSFIAKIHKKLAFWAAFLGGVCDLIDLEERELSPQQML